MKFGGFRTRVAPFTTFRARAGTARRPLTRRLSHGAAPARRAERREALREVW